MYTTCSAGILSLQFSWTMNNLLSYCGLVDAKISASEKDLSVTFLGFKGMGELKIQKPKN